MIAISSTENESLVPANNNKYDRHLLIISTQSYTYINITQVQWHYDIWIYTPPKCVNKSEFNTVDQSMSIKHIRATQSYREVYRTVTVDEKLVSQRAYSNNTFCSDVHKLINIE